jgi:uroporphyrinogen-III synthase
MRKSPLAPPFSKWGTKVKVIVTRPRLEAESWVKQLRALHFDAIALPLINIGAPPDNGDVAKAWRHLPQYRAVMFVSSNAVRYFYQLNTPSAGVFVAYEAIKNIVNSQDKTAKTRMWATGPGTREALLAQSVPGDLIDSPDSDAAQFDSEALWGRVQHQVKPGDKVLIVRGSSLDSKDADGVAMNGRPWLADQLMAAGAQVDIVVSYQRSAPVFGTLELELMTQAAADKSVWLLSSSEAVANLVVNLKAIPELNLSQARAIATHPRIAHAARKAGFGVVYESRPLLVDVAASIESLL